MNRKKLWLLLAPILLVACQVVGATEEGADNKRCEGGRILDEVTFIGKGNSEDLTGIIVYRKDYTVKEPVKAPIEGVIHTKYEIAFTHFAREYQVPENFPVGEWLTLMSNGAEWKYAEGAMEYWDATPVPVLDEPALRDELSTCFARTPEGFSVSIK